MFLLCGFCWFAFVFLFGLMVCLVCSLKMKQCQNRKGWDGERRKDKVGGRKEEGIRRGNIVKTI